MSYPIPGNDDATKSIKAITTFIADSVIEGRKKFLSYLSHEGVAAKPDALPQELPAVLPEEEIKIKEIEEIVEESVPTEEELKSLKKGRVKPALEGIKTRKKV